MDDGIVLTIVSFSLVYAFILAVTVLLLILLKNEKGTLFSVLAYVSDKEEVRAETKLKKSKESKPRFTVTFRIMSSGDLFTLTVPEKVWREIPDCAEGLLTFERDVFLSFDEKYDSADVM